MITYNLECDTTLVKQPHIINAYLESDKTILTKLSTPVTLPWSTSYVTVTDKTTNQVIPASSVDIAQSYQPVVVGDFQHVLGSDGNWNNADPQTSMKKVNANLYQVTVKLPAGIYQYKIAFSGVWDGAFPPTNISLTVPYSGASVTFSFVPFDLTKKQAHVYDSINHPNVPLPLSSAGISTDLLLITLRQMPDITHVLQVGLKDFKENHVIPRNVLSSECYTYTGEDLGYTFSEEVTSFRLWAPTASDVHLLLYEHEVGPIAKQVAMQRDVKGTWHVRVAEPLENWYYLYRVTVHGMTRTAVDPYANALAPNATLAMIVDLRKTDPDGWNDDHSMQLADPVDAVIYETHVRDFSICTNSGMTNKGKYLAFTERETSGPAHVTTGVESLKQLGITHVQVLPIADFASIDECLPDEYNWGYDPRTYNVPQGAYASTPHGTARITEYKKMIQSLHREHIGIIMDVVYNHTFVTHASDFDKIVPQYYYRTDDAGDYTNGSGVGNEIATERPMVQKFVRDSLKFWVREYHVDGFRFDLMALLGVDTLRSASLDLHEIDPEIMLYGEPWIGGSSALPGYQLLTKGQQKGLKVGVFNDHIRNGLIGSVFEREVQGFVSGAKDRVDAIKAGVLGSINDFAAVPGEVINYVSSHDNLTLWDKLEGSNPEDSGADRIRMDKLALSVIMTAQGVPFMQGGEEFLRTKEGNDNSYNAGDAVNQFDWSRKAQYQDVFNYYADLIALRKQHPAFRMRSAEAINAHLSFLNSPENTVAFLLSEHANGDAWKNILVIYNPNKTDVEIDLPPGMWNIAEATEIGNKKSVPAQIEKVVAVPSISCMILYQE